MYFKKDRFTSLVFAGENRTPEFTKLNPMQKVPVMVDNGFVLTERCTHPQKITHTHYIVPKDPKLASEHCTVCPLG